VANFKILPQIFADYFCENLRHGNSCADYADIPIRGNLREIEVDHSRKTHATFLLLPLSA
jgi:hypothetical protein